MKGSFAAQRAPVQMPEVLKAPLTPLGSPAASSREGSYKKDRSLNSNWGN